MKKIITLLKDKERLYKILFTDEDKWSRPVDITIMIAIVLCAISAAMESVVKVNDFSLHALLNLEMTTRGIIKFAIILLEYLLSLIFTVEYILRIYCSPVKREYVLSFFGVIDFLATMPQVLSVFFPPLRYFSIMRTFIDTHLPCIEIVYLHQRGYIAIGEHQTQHDKDIGVFSLCSSVGMHHRHHNVYCGVSPPRHTVHRYTDKHILGYCDIDNGRLWRHHARHGTWSVPVGRGNDIRLHYYSSAYRHRFRYHD